MIYIDYTLPQDETRTQQQTDIRIAYEALHHVSSIFQILQHVDIGGVLTRNDNDYDRSSRLEDFRDALHGVSELGFQIAGNALSHLGELEDSLSSVDTEPAAS